MEVPFLSRALDPASNVPQPMRSWVLIPILCASCGGDEHPQPSPTNDPGAGSLIDHQRWVELTAENDPFASHRHEAVICPEWSRQIEGELYEVETDDCNYVSLSQPSLRPLKRGDRVETVFWHLWLWAPQPAQAHVAITIGDWVIADELIDIPGPEQSFNPVLTVPEDMPQGTPIVFHLHNHGVNSWRLLSIDRLIN